MFHDFSSFSKELQKGFPSLCLIIAKETKEAVDLVIKSWQGRVRSFDGDNFSIPSFNNEVETFSFFQEPLLCYIQEIDKLKEYEIKVIIDYLKHPNKSIFLLLSSSVLLLTKEVKRQEGIILHIAEEKLWQKKQRMERYLASLAQSSGVSFPIESIKFLIECVGCNKDILSLEFEKLMTYAFTKKIISIEDVKELVHKSSSYTLWDLGEAIFSKDFPLSYECSKALVEEGTSLFMILAQLRTQIRTLMTMGMLYAEGGNSLLVQKFPYLRGSILTKKIDELQKNSLRDLKKKLFFLFEAELHAKNLNLDPLFILEILLIKLTGVKNL